MKNTVIKPQISIITAAYNSEDYIDDCIKSIRSQTYSNWELIIINDGSTDDTEKAILEFSRKDSRIKYHKNDKNIGLIATLNKGIKISTGTYIARLDTDDIWVDPMKLQKQLDYLQKEPNTILIGTWGYRLNSKGENIGNIQYPTSDRSIRNYILIENCFLHSAVMFNRDIVIKNGLYSKEFKSAEDYELWLKLGRSGEFHNLPKYMVGYRINDSGISATRYKEQQLHTIKAVNRYKEDYPFSTVALFLWRIRSIIPRDLRERISRLVRLIGLRFLTDKF